MAGVFTEVFLVGVYVAFGGVMGASLVALPTEGSFWGVDEAVDIFACIIFQYRGGFEDQLLVS